MGTYIFTEKLFCIANTVPAFAAENEKQRGTEMCSKIVVFSIISLVCITVGTGCYSFFQDLEKENLCFGFYDQFLEYIGYWDKGISYIENEDESSLNVKAMENGTVVGFFNQAVNLMIMDTYMI